MHLGSLAVQQTSHRQSSELAPVYVLCRSLLPMTMRPATTLHPLVRVRRSASYRPTLLSRAALPSQLQYLRRITIQASPPSSSDTPSDREATNFEIVDDAPSTSSSSFASSSQHPFSSIEIDPVDMSGTNVPARSSTLPPPPILSERQWTRFQHPFDTHAFVNYLEKAGMNTGTSTALMEAVRKMIVTRSDKTRESMMAKEDMENVSRC